MTLAHRTTAALLAGTLVLGASACGGGSKKKAATTTTATTGTSTTATTTKSGKKKATPLSQTPAKTLNFSGSGPKEIGVPPLRIPVNSILKWTNDAPPAVRLFQVIPASPKVQSPVNSRAASGQAPIRKGAYHGFLVNADGKWTLTIVPGG
jgi:hypothetical protein